MEPRKGRPYLKKRLRVHIAYLSNNSHNKIKIFEVVHDISEQCSKQDPV